MPDTEFENAIEATRHSGRNLVAMLALPDCPHCDEYFPIFESVKATHCQFHFCKAIAEHRSDLKRKYLRAEIGARMSAPATLFFRNGEVERKHFGKMTREQLIDFIEGREVQVSKQKTLEDLIVPELNELLCKQKIQRADTDKAIASIEWEISKR